MNPEIPYTPAKLYHSAKTGKNGKLIPWYIYYFFTDPQTNERVMFKRTGKMNYIHNYRQRLKYGNELVEIQNRDLKNGYSPFGNSNLETLKGVLEKMYAIKKPNLRPRSIQAFKYCMDALYEWMNQNNLSLIYPEQFDVKMCHSFCDWLITEKKMKARNFNNHKGLIGSLFNMMEDREIIIKNPFRKIKSFPKTHGNNIPFSDEIKQKLIDEMILKDYRLYLFCQFIYYCFIRPMELTRLRVGNIDLKNKKITLHGSQTKNKKNASVVIPDAFIKIVESMELEKYDADDYVFGKNEKGEAFVPAKKQMSRNSATQRHLEIIKTLKFPKELTLYSHKDTGVCNAYRAGVSIYYLMVQLRHSSLAHTQIYLNSLGLMDNVEFASKMK